jgi:hypothetical protein
LSEPKAAEGKKRPEHHKRMAPVPHQRGAVSTSPGLFRRKTTI